MTKTQLYPSLLKAVGHVLLVTAVIKVLDPVVRKAISAKSGLKVNLGFYLSPFFIKKIYIFQKLIALEVKTSQSQN